jgi:hypothetical protein
MELGLTVRNHIINLNATQSFYDYVSSSLSLVAAAMMHQQFEIQSARVFDAIILTSLTIVAVACRCAARLDEWRRQKLLHWFDHVICQ